ncbi:MAG: hypothetical protein HKN06_09280 [Gammaproteobacteria bacterium]|nr:hypothetical protein [Gammaproteobacteria bacterium]
MSSKPSQATPGSTILAQRHARDIRRYFDRHGYAAPPALSAPDADPGLVVVIPALAEPDLVATLQSVAAASRPHCAVEILVVINAPDDAGTETRRINAESLQQAEAWARNLDAGRFGCHVLDYRDLPAQQASVGLARKLGMDAALARLAASREGRGLIVSLDADCRVASNYLTAIAGHFVDHPGDVGAVVCFEHPLEDAPGASRSSIIDYELHLRCYRNGLQAADSPYACHTVGSAMVVRSEIYAQEGGMNRRAAGEDFYFINKLLKRGSVGEINETTVFPSARVSTRVPFGTGAAMGRAQTEAQTTYAPAAYRELQVFQRTLHASVRNDQPMPSEYEPFLDSMGYATWLNKTRANVASMDSLAAQLVRWLDGFRTMKFINWLTGSRYPRVPVAEAAREIISWHDLSAADDSRGLLEQLRELDRESDRSDRRVAASNHNDNGCF